MKKRDSEWISPEKFWASTDRHELKRYWDTKEGQTMKQKLRSVEMQRQPATSYLPNHREEEEQPNTRLTAKQYYSTPEGKRRQELKKLDAEAKKPTDLKPRLVKANPTEPEKAVRSRTSTSQYPPCKECQGKISSPQNRKRNGFCSARCRMRWTRREKPKHQAPLEDFLKLQALVTVLEQRLFEVEKRQAKAGWVND